MPILKQLVSGSSQTKRRSRMDLTREMISAPLGDFRHTMHVGRSGDAFGDTSFLSTRSGEPAPRQAEPTFPRSPRPGLLSRTFRSSKRSQSVTRVDEEQDGGGDGGAAFVKNAMSLPFLNDEEDGGRTAVGGVPKSMSTSPLKQLGDQLDLLPPSNGAAAGAARSLELDERSFGELTELPGNLQPYGGCCGGGGGMKRADSVMSFHVDLGPSMLGDILDVMEKEDDDLGYEEGEGRISPTLEEPVEEPGEEPGDVVEEEEKEEEEEEEEAVSECQPGSADLEQESGVDTPEFTPETRPRHPQHLDSCSVSSSGSAPLEDRPNGQNHGGDADSANFSAPPEEEGHFSSFMEDEDEDDEIRV